MYSSLCMRKGTKIPNNHYDYFQIFIGKSVPIVFYMTGLGPHNGNQWSKLQWIYTVVSYLNTFIVRILPLIPEVHLMSDTVKCRIRMGEDSWYSIWYFYSRMSSGPILQHCSVFTGGEVVDKEERWFCRVEKILTASQCKDERAAGDDDCGWIGSVH